MSIVRISALKGAIHGVTAEGTFEHGPYSRRSALGRTDPYSEPPEAAGGLGDVPVGAVPMNARAADMRGFPRETSDLMHLMRSRYEPALAGLADDQPVTVLVHGFLFDPRSAVSPAPADTDNPHGRLYHFKIGDLDDEIREHTSSWPAGLGYAEDDFDGADGMTLAFGWHSSPGFASSLISHFKNFYARAYENAEVAAWNLLTALHCLDRVLTDREIATGAPRKKIDVFCHSLGSRVVVRAVALAAKHLRLDILDRLDRVIVLGGAEYVVEARHMLRRLSSVGMLDDIHFYNVVSRENDVLDKLGENFGPRTFGNSNVIGHNGLDVEESASLGGNWLDLQIDGSKLRRWMEDNRGIAVTGDNPNSMWDHWYYFTDRGNMELYRKILRQRADWGITDLRALKIPDKVSRRRSIWGD